jgi:hypothetical protein
VQMTDFYHARNVVVTTPDPIHLDKDFSGKFVIDCWRLLRNLAPREYLPLGIGPCAD